MWEQFKRVIKPRGAVVLTASGKFSYQLVMSNFEWFRYEIIAEKDGVTGHLNANRQPLKAHEAVCVFYQKHPTYNPQLIPGKEYSATSGAAGGYIRDKNTGGYTTVNTGYRYPRSVIKFNWPINLMHPTQKPVALFEYLIRTYTNAVDVVFDPCCGSGTTAVAAWRSERRFICGDNNLEYVQVARKRLVEADPYNPKQIGDKVQMSLFAGLKND
jgi:site-specific DNA-methyltransferase (adenine-specific)